LSFFMFIFKNNHSLPSMIIKNYPFGIIYNKNLSIAFG